MFDAGLLSTEDFVYLINRDIINITDNPHKEKTYAELLASAKKGIYGTDYKKLSYYKGALIALNWEAQVKQSGSGEQLKDLIREIYDTAFKNNQDIVENSLFVITIKYGINCKEDLKQYFLAAHPIIPHPDALSGLYE